MIEHVRKPKKYCPLCKGTGVVKTEYYMPPLFGDPKNEHVETTKQRCPCTDPKTTSSES